MKTKNFLINKRDNYFELIIADFGTALFKKLDNKSITQFTRNTVIGTEPYLAPELYNELKNYTEDFKYKPKLSDAYSLGVILL